MKTPLIAAVLVAGGAASAASIPPPGRQIETKTPAYEFAYGYPAAAGRIRALKAWLDKDAAKQEAGIAAQAKEGRAAARKDGFPFHPYDSSTQWQVVADLPAWLSLSGVSGDYTGGAHPNHGPTALLWDKARNRKVEATGLFNSTASLSATIRAPFCAALNKQREEKRGAPIDPKSKDEFDACIDPVKQTVILGSADHAHFTRIGIMIGPYEAGPYVEGDYEVTLPVTAAVMAAVRPEYRAAFAIAPAPAAKGRK